MQLHTAATTGAALSLAGAAPAVRPSQPTNLTWQARQDLVWEDSTALVLSYARFSDGAVMDVTDKTAVAAMLPSGGSGVLPFGLNTDNTTGLRWLTVNTTVSGWDGRLIAWNFRLACDSPSHTQPCNLAAC